MAADTSTGAARRSEKRQVRSCTTPHISREKQDQLIEEAKEHVRSNKEVYEDLAS